LKAVSVEMALFAAVLLEVAGSPNSEAFSALILATNGARQAKPLLRDIAENGGKLLSSWSDSIAAAFPAS
jgi:hypothetical protein